MDTCAAIFCRCAGRGCHSVRSFRDPQVAAQRLSGMAGSTRNRSDTGGRANPRENRRLYNVRPTSAEPVFQLEMDPTPMESAGGCRFQFSGPYPSTESSRKLTFSACWLVLSATVSRVEDELQNRSLVLGLLWLRPSQHDVNIKKPITTATLKSNYNNNVC